MRDYDRRESLNRKRSGSVASARSRRKDAETDAAQPDSPIALGVIVLLIDAYVGWRSLVSLATAQCSPP